MNTFRSKVIVINNLDPPNEKWEESKTIESATNEWIASKFFPKWQQNDYSIIEDGF